MAKELTSKNYVTILGWMVNDLHLKGSELLVYAIIHGFCQDGDSEFTGSVAYLQAWTGLSYQGTANVLKSLVQKGLLAKVSETRNGIIYCRYQTLYPPKKLGTLPNHLGTPSQKTWDNIDSINNTPKGVNISIPPTPFNFRQSLIGLGVEEEVVDDWLRVRKAKKGVNTKTAFAAIEKEILLAQAAGQSATACIRLAAEKSWVGFKWEWMENELSSRSSRSAAATGNGAPRRGTTAVDRMLDLGATMFGPQKPVYDEQ
ncbi:MAG: helix-turn-helix domain-containing protein [Bacteroidales bacterium]|nr:helix-turn-helix domain-containing protein [Bacteroidales bacterium]